MPNSRIIKTEINLKKSADTPKALTIVVRNNVKKVKLAIKPIITPIGRLLPGSSPGKVEDRIMGNIGSMHGESMVTIPAKNEKAIKINI